MRPQDGGDSLTWLLAVGRLGDRRRQAGSLQQIGEEKKRKEEERENTAACADVHVHTPSSIFALCATETRTADPGNAHVGGAGAGAGSERALNKQSSTVPHTYRNTKSERTRNKKI